jgi:hypothetical protein
MEIIVATDDQGAGTIAVPGVARPVVVCGDGLGDEHASAFVNEFIPRSARERWLELIVTLRPEWSRLPRGARAKKLYWKVSALLDAYQPADGGVLPYRARDVTEIMVHRPVRERTGVLIYPDIPYCYLTLAEARDLFMLEDSSMILSIEAGMYAFVFCHGGYVYTCSK